MTLVESGEPWIGKVPMEWSRSRIRNVTVFSPGYSGQPPKSDEVCTVVPMEKLSDDGTIDTSNQQEVKNVQSGLTLFEEGDVIFAKITPCMENGKGAFVESLPTRYGFGSTEYHVLRPSCAVHPKFLYYYTFNPVFRAYAAENMSGAAGQKRVSSRFLRDTRLYLPPRPEQDRIAAYLDASCAAIDAAVAAKRRQIETLDALRKATINQAVTGDLLKKTKRQHTGILWFPTIPINWRIIRFKGLFNEIYRYPSYFNIDYVENGIPEVRGEALSSEGKIKQLEDERYISPATNNLFPRTQLLFGDLVMSVRGTMGKIGLVDERYVGANITANLLRLSPKRVIVSGEFIKWVILSIYFNEALNASSPQTTIKTVTMPQLARIAIAIPPRDEQDEIVEYLETKLAELKTTFALLNQQIITLLAYRKSLIHECVTGQRRVTDDDVARVVQGKFGIEGSA